MGLTTGACLPIWATRSPASTSSRKRSTCAGRFRSTNLAGGNRTRNVSGPAVFTTDYAEALADADIVFICVGTPSGVDGERLRYVRMAAESIAQMMTHPLIVVNKSTVPVGTGDWVADIISRSQPAPIDFSVVSCPEFMREGSALYDFMNPDRVVLGSKDEEAAEKVAQLHLPLRTRIVLTDLRTAEMIKYASNAFLATKISFINEIAAICERLGADVQDVAIGMSYDKRIGPHFLNAGLGYGGSCFPKDVKALEHMALVQGSHPSLLRAVMDINRDARRWPIFTLREMLGHSLNNKRVGLLGLAFKPNTDDTREAPALEIARMLQYEGAVVSAYDPVAWRLRRAIIRSCALPTTPTSWLRGKMRSSSAPSGMSSSSWICCASKRRCTIPSSWMGAISTNRQP